MIALILGGARSGKSAYALDMAKKYHRRAFIATAQPTDPEMAERIARHKKDREGLGFATFEQYRDIAPLIMRGGYDVWLLDCVGTMITNMLMEEPPRSEREITAEFSRIMSAARAHGSDLIIVSNEVGLSLVPEYPLSRQFRDIAGRVNMAMAKEANAVWFMVAGLPQRLK